MNKKLKKIAVNVVGWLFLFFLIYVFYSAITNPEPRYKDLDDYGLHPCDYGYCDIQE